MLIRTIIGLGSVDRFEELVTELNVFKNIRAAKFELSKLEKWMFDRLQVERLPTGKGPGKKKGQGSKRFYKHLAMERVLGDGNFTIHVIHKKREMVITNSFRKFVYGTLVEAIAYMKLEEEK